MKEKVYDQQIFPLMEKIIKICNDNDIAFCGTFNITDKDDQDGPLRCTTGVNLENDTRIKECHRLARNGGLFFPVPIGAIKSTKDSEVPL